MGDMDRLFNYLPPRTYGIVSAYHGDEILALVAGVTIREDDSLLLSFPKANPFRKGELVTIHLDNRTGIETFTPDLRVYRCSYKGLVVDSRGEELVVAPEEFLLRYSNRAVIEYMRDGYRYPPDGREGRDLAAASLDPGLLPDPHEEANKLGVWITRGIDRPHTTVMAFLSSRKDDIFVISNRDSFKSSLAHKDGRCAFAIDHRAEYNFERKYEWNYTILTAEARLVPKESPDFGRIQALFVEKNPWEIAFFTGPWVELFHLEPLKILCPDTYA
jgi:hypothetical protein